ncbi:MAG: AAA family ATPase [Planctomycetota bacterium]
MNDQLSGLGRDVVLPRPIESPTPWVAVAGAKGGVGKTTLAVNLALLLQKAGYRTLLVDLDPGCGNVGVHPCLAARRDLEDAAAGACALRDALIAGPGGVAVLLGKSASTALARSGAETTLASLFAAIADVARDFDVVVADTGAGLGPVTLAAVERADLALAVTTPDAAALTDTYALAKVMTQLGRPLPRIVVNRCKSRDEAARTAGKLAAVTAKFLGAAAAMCGFVLDDGLLALAVADQRPLALFGQGQALDDLRGLCAAVLAELPARRRHRPAATPAAPTIPTAVRLRPARS